MLQSFRPKQTEVHNRKGAKTPSHAKEVLNLRVHPMKESPVPCNALALQLFASLRLAFTSLFPQLKIEKAYDVL